MPPGCAIRFARKLKASPDQVKSTQICPGKVRFGRYNSRGRPQVSHEKVPMTKAAASANLARHKLALAKKYENRSRAANSKPLKEKLKRLSEKYRRQATQFAPGS